MFCSWLALIFLLWELFFSSIVHLLFGLYIFSSAVAGDVTAALNLNFWKFNLVNFEPNPKTEVAIKSSSRNFEELSPIVLVHGIFGFGKGVRNLWPSITVELISQVLIFFLFISLQRLGSLSYFAGAENKDERVLVPDLGSLTSVYDRLDFLNFLWWFLFECLDSEWPNTGLDVRSSARVWKSEIEPSGLEIGVDVKSVCCCFACWIWNWVSFRARELFYYLKGGQVDYGEEHSRICGHSRFGRLYERGKIDPIYLIAMKFLTMVNFQV